jgi:hypothetical protein
MAKKSDTTEKRPDPKAYTSPNDVYTAGIYTKSGEPFVTDADPLDEWIEKTPEEAHAIDASQNKVPADPPLESLGIEALRAVAVTKNINVTDMDEAQLITAIKAANEPAL